MLDIDYHFEPIDVKPLMTFLSVLYLDLVYSFQHLQKKHDFCCFVDSPSTLLHLLYVASRTEKEAIPL